MNDRDASGTPPLTLTVRQPWAAAIFWASPPKDVENRMWRTGYRGRLLIHAGTRADPGWRHSPQAAVLAAIPEERRTLHGVIIGSVELTDCIPDSDSPWTRRTNRWRWVLADPQPWAEPVPARGQMGLWTPEGRWL
jgi:hypothetical protein